MDAVGSSSSEPIARDAPPMQTERARDTHVPRILMWIPLPPPFAGPEIASALLADACKQHVPDVRVENASLRTSNMARGRFDLDGVLAFARAYRRFIVAARDSDVVYMVAANSQLGSLRDAVLAGTARAMRKQVVLHLRGGNYSEYFAASSPAMQRVLRATWGSASRAIVQTPGLRDMLRAAAPHVDVAVLPNALRGGELPAKQSYASRSPRILFVGHLTYHKGFYDLMHAFARVRRVHPTATLVCAGELPQPIARFADFVPASRRAEYLARHEAICDKIRAFVTGGNGVEYAGVVDRVAKRELFLGADVFALPSYTEGFSVAVLEAMFHGLPIVAARTGGTPDVVREGENGLLVEAGAQDQLAESLIALLDDRELRETIGRRNAQLARERYDIDVVAPRFAAMLRDVPMQPQGLLHVITTLEGGGAERQLSMLAREQVRRGYDVHVATRRVGVYGEQLRAAGVTVHELGDLRRAHPLLFVRLAALVQRVRPAVIQTWLAQMDIVGGVVATAARVPWIVTERSTGEGHAATPAIARLRRVVGRGAKAVVANSRAGARYWEDIAPARTTTVPNAVEIGEIRAASIPGTRVICESTAATGTTVLCVGRLVDYKAPGVVLDALRHTRTELHLTFLGDGPLHDSLAQHITKHGLTDRVSLQPFRRDWWDLLRTATALVSTSRFEGQPNVILEAMAARCPLVVSDISAHREILDEHSAIFVPLDDPRAVARALDAIATDPEAARARADRAFARVAEFTIERTADAYDRVYAEVTR